MRQTWRWFGPSDPVSISDARQAGAEAIVTALHHIPPGEPWTPAEIARRQEEVARLPSGADSGLRWEVVESVFVSEDIKSQTGAWRAHLEAYKDSLRNLAAAGIRTVAFHFMPVLDWTRTDLDWVFTHGGRALRFDIAALAAFDVHILRRAGAREGYSEAVLERADRLNAELTEDGRTTLVGTIIAGLPGSSEGWTLESFGERLQSYDAIDADRLRRHLIDFLSEVTPVAESLGVKLCYHPDDPPFPILGLPRVMSTEADFQAVFEAVDSPSNGMTFCTGSLGVRADNDLPAMARRLGPRIHFAHLRNVKRESDTVPCSFHEDEHLSGDTNMVRVLEALLGEEARRRAAGEDAAAIPMRPDHGHQILSDLGRRTNPGYSAIGRLKGLAELRGAIAALEELGAGARR